LLRAHLLGLRLVLLSVLIGVVLAPGAAFSYEGRLSGALWPIPPTQVAHYAATLLGCTVVLWFSGLVSGRASAITLVGTVLALIGTHTRTAIIGLLLGLVVAGASLAQGHVRVRRTATVVAVAAGIGSIFFTPLVVSWASRGQSLQEASQLTGRTAVWTEILTQHRTWLEQWFGSGLSNKSYNGLAIDSSWVAGYHELGFVGLGLITLFLVVLLATASGRPRGPHRAVALFLLVYCLFASVTETGLSDASPYLLELSVAASLLATPAGARTPRESGVSQGLSAALLHKSTIGGRRRAPSGTAEGRPGLEGNGCR
jgi:O-antigen ligase